MYIIKTYIIQYFRTETHAGRLPQPKHGVQSKSSDKKERDSQPSGKDKKMGGAKSAGDDTPD